MEAMNDDQAELEEFGKRRRYTAEPDRGAARGLAAGGMIMARESLLKLVQFVSIMLYVLVAGVLWGTWLSLARTMTEYDAATFLADDQHMIKNLATVMAVLMISAVIVGVVAVVLLAAALTTRPVDRTVARQPAEVSHSAA
jgi:hypothetical protein